MGDSYRPDRSRPLADRVTFTSGGGDNYDSYRPGPPTGPRNNGRQNGEFTFTSGRQGPQFPPIAPEDSNNPRRRNNRGRGGNRGQRNRPGEQNGFRGGPRRSGPYRKPGAHERALLRTRDLDGASPERTFGVTDGVNRFLNLEDLSESENEKMEIENGDEAADDSAGDVAQPSKKAARGETTDRADGDSVPKWSNPDPYIVLPPPGETTGKKRDFVHLIRKAKNDEHVVKKETENAVAANDDFISLNFGDEDGEDETVDEEEGEVDEKGVPPPPGHPPPREAPPPPPPPPPVMSGSLNDVAAAGSSAGQKQGAKRDAQAAGLPQRPQHPGRSNKRKRDQFLGGIVAEWQTRARGNPTPWCANARYRDTVLEKGAGRSDYEKMLMLLHNEIYDFYDYVEPHDKDHAVRNRLVRDIQSLLGGRGVILPDHAQIMCFGSFPAKLYLPTADMDLVLATRSHISGGPRTVDLGNPSARRQSNSVLYGARRKLERFGMATDCQVIARAKVPLVKYIDRRTGIKVDLSFENLSGVVAQETYKRWNEEMDTLAPMVLLVKQFLVMRGLSDVHTGGLGGFSIVCLVYHYLYHHQPELAKEGGILNIGKLFIGFLDFWGKRFDIATQRVVMAPCPTIVQKQSMGIDGRAEKVDGLSIQDPNNEENNISGGSHRAAFVLEQFGEAWDALDARLQTLDLSGTSILEAILGGNYESYDLQRQTIEELS